MLYRLEDSLLLKKRELPFKLKSQVQKVVEDNLTILLNLSHIKSDFVVDDVRFDSLAFDQTLSSFVVLSFVRGDDYSILDRAFSSLAVILKHKAEFVLEYIYKTGMGVTKGDINWDKLKVIFVSQNFTKTQIESVSYKDLPIELYRIRKFHDLTVQFTPLTFKPVPTFQDILDNDEDFQEEHLDDADINLDEVTQIGVLAQLGEVSQVGNAFQLGDVGINKNILNISLDSLNGLNEDISSANLDYELQINNTNADTTQDIAQNSIPLVDEDIVSNSRVPVYTSSELSNLEKKENSFIKIDWPFGNLSRK